MIPLTDFLTHISAIAAESPSYRLGGDGSDGSCDCIGLIIGAIRRAGGKWPGTHGSNWAARNAMASLTENPALKPGLLVFKARSPQDGGYNLPEKYLSGSDLNDYYHVGVVTNTAPLEITHCTFTGEVNGIAVDTKIGAWRFGGMLKMVSDVPMEMATVRASSGKTVNLRKNPGGDLLDRVPVGSCVNVLEKGDQWSQIAWEGHMGFMQTRFLDFEEAADLLTALKALITKYERG
ncbi:MAG: hypothetical protein IJ461_05880 [Clostridia bacterium]|nr:hypothetical protein [Clostridia bacterium]